MSTRRNDIEEQNVSVCSNQTLEPSSPETDEVLYLCTECGNNFESTFNLDEHLTSCHDPDTHVQGIEENHADLSAYFTSES